MATPSSILSWRIPWTEEPGRLQSIGSHKGGHDQSELAQHKPGHIGGAVTEMGFLAWK